MWQARGLLCRALAQAFETVRIFFEKKRDILTVLRITALFNSKRELKLALSLSSLFEVT